MSYHTLQRVVVRMLFDERFVQAVYDQPDEALSGLDLSEQERRQLLATDRRAWRYDPLRRLRTLRTLVEEFKVSTTLVLAETRRLASLDGFFSSTQFHQSVQQRGSMGLAFSQFISDNLQQGLLKTAQLPDVLRLETTLARCRRDLDSARGLAIKELPARISDTLRVRLAPGVAVGSFQGNTIATIQHVEKYLFEASLMPAMALCDDAPRLGELPPIDTKNKIYLQFAPGASGITLVNIEKDEFLTLIEARAFLTIRQLFERSATSGVSRGRAQEIVSAALDDQLLIVE